MKKKEKKLTRNRFTFGSQLYRKIQFKRVTRKAESNPKAIENHATSVLPNRRKEKWKRIFYIRNLKRMKDIIQKIAC